MYKDDRNMTDLGKVFAIFEINKEEIFRIKRFL